jgi:polar amino acid transport system substrate-binding protein
VLKLLQRFVLVIAGLGAWPAWANHDPLHLSFPENPPLSYTNGAGPRGLFIEALRQRSASTNLVLSFDSRPAKRILAEIEANRSPICSLGWYRTAEREAFAKFSRPIYRDRAITIVSALPASTFAEAGSLSVLLARGTYRIGAISGLSYGPEVDRILAGHQSMVMRPTVTVEQMLRMVVAGRMPLAVVTEEHLNWFLEREPGDTRLTRLALSDLPKTGPQRYIMCSRRTPDEFIKRIDALIGDGLVPGHN